GANPWGAHTLEWRIPSPPPSYGFLLVPVMPGAFGVWNGDVERSGAPTVTHGIRADARELLVTTAIDARLDHRQRHPAPSLWPLVMALAVGATFIGAVFTPWTLAICAGTYLYLRSHVGDWPPPATPLPGLGMSSTNVALMLASLGPVWWTARAARRLDILRARVGLALCSICGVGFLFFRWFE